MTSGSWFGWLRRRHLGTEADRATFRTLHTAALATPALRGGLNEAYGCCALALSAHQTDLAPGWAGDDRVAIHATPDKGSIGSAATNGCMRVPDKDAAWLMTRVPLGTVVTIRS